MKSTDQTNTIGTEPGEGPWGSALAQLRQWDPKWAATCLKFSTNPWTGGVLPRKLVELVCIALNVSPTNLNPEGTRRHIRAALQAGASRDEILFVIKMAAVVGIHSCSVGAPILLEEAKAAGVKPAPRTVVPTPICDKARAMGAWSPAWDPFYELDPQWTDQYLTTGLFEHVGNVPFTPKEVELIDLSFNASYTHLYAPSMRRHIQLAFKAGATMEEIMEVLKICVVQGVQACNLGVPILAEELATR